MLPPLDDADEAAPIISLCERRRRLAEIAAAKVAAPCGDVLVIQGIPGGCVTESIPCELYEGHKGEHEGQGMYWTEEEKAP